MEENHDITPGTERMLNSLEGLRKATPGAFFFTRVQARLQKDEISLWGRIAYFMAKPSFAFTTLFAIFLLNATVLVYQHSNPAAVGITDQAELATTEDYNTTLAANSYYDENTEAR